jgi:hypothetical protein
VLRGTRGFEILVGGKWIGTKITSHTKDTVTVAGVAGGQKLRNSWYSNPCGLSCFGCAVYVAAVPVVMGHGAE